MELNLKQKAAYGIGAVGKDMVYALSASYVMYYYQDILGLSATFVGLILMAARIFDALNDLLRNARIRKIRRSDRYGCRSGQHEFQRVLRTHHAAHTDDGDLYCLCHLADHAHRDGMNGGA